MIIVKMVLSGDPNLLRGINKNDGLISVKLGKARVEVSYHQFIHYYELKGLYSEYNNVKFYFENFLNISKGNITIMDKLEMYTDMMNNTIKKIDVKIDNLRSNSEKRERRGLINGLGSIVKFVTGNLDSEDGKEIRNVISNLKENQKNIVNQLKYQYSISNDIIDKFNDTINILRVNNINFAKKLIGLEYKLDILYMKEMLSQMEILLTLILEILEEIENSLLFCKLNTIHPSIMNSRMLFNELLKIQKYYKNQFLYDIKFNNIIDFELLMDVDCYTGEDQIIYVLRMPLFEEIEYELLQLYEVPILINEEILILNSRFNRVLKKDETLKYLTEPCRQIKDLIYSCKARHISLLTDYCLTSIILRTKKESCSYLKTSLPENEVVLLEGSQYLLLLFYKEDEIELISETEQSHYNIQGIFLIKLIKYYVKYKENIFHLNSSVINTNVITVYDESKFIKNYEADKNMLNNSELVVKDFVNFEYLQRVNRLHILEAKEFKSYNSIEEVLIYLAMTLVTILIILKAAQVLKKCLSKPVTQENIQNSGNTLRGVPI